MRVSRKAKHTIKPATGVFQLCYAFLHFVIFRCVGVAEGCCGNIVETREEKVARFLRKLGPARFVLGLRVWSKAMCCLNGLAKSGEKWKCKERMRRYEPTSKDMKRYGKIRKKIRKDMKDVNVAKKQKNLLCFATG